jgi:GT2 family glycosyltransferase
LRSSETEPQVGLVIVHWGNVDDTLTCLSSVAASDQAPRLVVVIDNGTRALNAPMVEKAARGTELIHLPENVGFTGGANAGIQHALATGVDFVALVNNDAVLEPSCLGELLRVARTSGPRVAVVGAKTLCAHDPSTLSMAYGRLTYRAALIKWVGEGESATKDFGPVRDVDWISACVALLSREALETIGLLDEEFFAYHDDVDWCTSAHEHGFRVLFAPEARAVHRGGGSLRSRGKSESAAYLSARNTVLFARKHARLQDWVRLCVTIGGSIPLEYARRRWRGTHKGFGLLVRGYVDGILGRRIPYRRLGLR